MQVKCVRCGRAMEMNPDDSRVAFYCEICQALGHTPKREASSKGRIIQLNLGDPLHVKVRW